MLRLRSVLLAAVLSGVPRALDTPAFGAGRSSVYVDVAAVAPRLSDFLAELDAAIGGDAYRLTGQPGGATLTVEIHNIWTSRSAGGRVSEAVSVTLRDGHETTPLVLHYVAGSEARAARALVRMLAHRP